MSSESEEQREQNPDVNSYNPDVDPAEEPGTGDDSDDGSAPLPPDAAPPVSIEEPPGSDGPPVGDVDDSPKRIA